MTETETIAEKISDIIGATHVSSAPADVHAFGGLDPIVVAWPGAAPEVAELLKVCRSLGVAVGISGAGTRATKHWPLTKGRPRLALGSQRMMNILEVDELSMTVHTQTGISLLHLEEALRRQKLTVGFYPAEVFHSTLGGLLALPHPKAHSPRYGWLTDACIALSVAHASGAVTHTRLAPRRATGPDLAKFYLGSRGSLGMITTAVLRVQRLPEHELALGFFLPDFFQAIELARDLVQRGIAPAHLKVLAENQARLEIGELIPNMSAVLLATLAGPANLVEKERLIIEQMIQNTGGVEIAFTTVQRWWSRETTLASPQENQPMAVGVRLPHSTLGEAVAAAPTAVRRKQLYTWAEEFTPQGATLWFTLREINEDQSALRAALLDAGMEPLRWSFPPLYQALRKELDPDETLVVMEA